MLPIVLFPVPLLFEIGHPFGVLGVDMKTRKRDSVSISKETKEFLDLIKRPGQSYDGVIRELVMCWKEKQEEEERK